jgi:L-glyceraldehyde 3-phosphate reductase
MPYTASPTRYDSMIYNRCGRSGLKLPAISLGLWHNFGFDKSAESKSAICRQAFDLGITHFDLANNYGPPPGAAEIAFGDILRSDFRGLRDELVISTKAGYDMWPGPYGEWGGRKYMLASLDQSLKRLGLDYVDIFYSHRFDPETPLDETMGALDSAVRQGKALYVGVSSYNSRPHQGGGGDPQGARDILPHPPAQLFDDQSVGRGRPPARHARGGGRRRDRLFATGARSPDRQISERGSRA